MQLRMLLRPTVFPFLHVRASNMVARRSDLFVKPTPIVRGVTKARRVSA